jgi:putative membrane-bound dehydrogenase-like protein
MSATAVRLSLLLSSWLLLAAPVLAAPPGDKPPPKESGFAVPDGFEVTLYADDDLASDIFSMTIDSHGRIVVASKGYIKILHDTDGDGRADKATLFSDMPKTGAHGMYFDGDDLICNGDNGVRKLYDTNGDGKCDKISPIWIPTIKDTEHAANGIAKGPDGWYYLISGNDAGLDKKSLVTATSPVKEPNAGVLMRFSPDGKEREVIAHGFRNPYDIDFNAFGDVFTVDADGERIHQMPYYAPNRLFDISTGLHHGWLLPGWQRGWSRPPYWPDSVPRLVEIGRGSPTGVTVYRHHGFPKKYRGGVFSLCWTFGNVYFFPLTRDGSTYKSEKETFMRTTGDVGFAPVDMAVGPDGDLFIAIGGRGTRGSVFRVHYTGKVLPLPGAGDPLREVLEADQPLSSWSRAKWVPAARKLGKEAFLNAVAETKLPLEERIRAVEIVTELFGGLPVELAKKVCVGKDDAELKARVLWAISRNEISLASRKLLVEMTRDTDPRIARAAWEGILRLPDSLDPATHTPGWRAGLTDSDLRVHAVTIQVARGPGRESFKAYQKKTVDSGLAEEGLAGLWVDGIHPENPEKVTDYFDECGWVFIWTETDRAKYYPLILESVRLVQIALGDVNTDEGEEKAFIGFVARSPEKIRSKHREAAARELAGIFPSGNDTLDLEIARTLAMLGEEVPGLPDKLAKKWTPQSRSDLDIHYLLALSRIPGNRSTEVTKQTAAALTGIHIKLAARGQKPTDQVPQILEVLLDRLMKHDPALAAALVADPNFGHPGHEMYAGKLPERETQAAARKLLTSIGKLDEDQTRTAWSPELVRLVASLPDKESLPILRQQFTDPRLADAITLILAAKKQPEDQPRFLDALNSTQPEVVRVAAKVLFELTQNQPKHAPVEIGKAIRALRKLSQLKTEAAPRQALTELLTHWTGQNLNNDPDPVKTAAVWVDWFKKTHPKDAAALPGLSEVDFAAWKQRLEKINWDAGNERTGQLIYQQKNCFRCHGDARRLGPDLTGVAQRFSRDDLFTAIILPNKDISPAYQPKSIVTTTGKVYTGMVIYDSPALTLLQTTPDTTVRITQEETQLVLPGAVSFMPAGLLDDLRDAELADLYAYIKTLRKK